MTFKIIECDTCGTEYNTDSLGGIVDLVRCIQCYKQTDENIEHIRYQKIKQTAFLLD